MTISPAEVLFATLGAAGWKRQPTRVPAEVDARLSFVRPGGRLVIESRPNGPAAPIWLWMHESDETRCLGLSPGHGLPQVLASLVSMQGDLGPSTYIGHMQTLQRICEVSVIAYEQFDYESPRERLRDAYGVYLYYPTPFTPNAEAIAAALASRISGLHRFGVLDFAHPAPPHPRFSVRPLGAPDRALLDAALEQTWDWDGAEDAVARAGMTLHVTDWMADGAEPNARVGHLCDVIAAVSQVHAPAAVHVPAAEQLLEPRGVLGMDPAQRWQMTRNIRFWRPAPGRFFMDTVGLDAFGHWNVEARYKGMDPGEMAVRLKVITQHVWKGAVFTKRDTIQGLSPVAGEEWVLFHARSTVKPDRPILRLFAGQFSDWDDE